MMAAPLPTVALSADARRAARVGGWSLILAALAFIAVFTYLAVRFSYPDVLDGKAEQVLPALLAMGQEGRGVWGIYGLLPLLLLPAGLGAHAVLREHAPMYARGAVLLAASAAAAMLLGLLRWPSIHWVLAESFVATDDVGQRAAITVLFDGLNSYLGNFIGEFVGEFTLNGFFLCVAWGSRGARDMPRWSVVAGLLAAAAGFTAIWRNVTPAVAAIAEIENSILPLWMILLGALLIRAGRAPRITEGVARAV